MLSKYKRDEKDEAMTFLIMILSLPEGIRFSHILDNFIQQYEHSPSLLLLISSNTIWYTHGETYHLPLQTENLILISQKNFW